MTTGSLVLVRTERQYTLASAFLRFQEYYENPKFRGEIFSLEKFMDWYAVKFGNFTYYNDWTGFNIPSSVLKPFREGKFNPLSKKEQRLLELLPDVPEPFYVVGVFGAKSDLSTLKHELVHGLFYTVPEYREKVLRAVAGKAKALRRILKKAGYHSAVWDDEVNVYLVAGVADLADDGFKWTPALRVLQRELRSIFHEQFGFAIRQANEAHILKFFRCVQLQEAPIAAPLDFFI